jgi:hypothetical protein
MQSIDEAVPTNRECIVNKWELDVSDEVSNEGGVKCGI